jgi:hypothetical protein
LSRQAQVSAFSIPRNLDEKCPAFSFADPARTASGLLSRFPRVRTKNCPLFEMTGRSLVVAEPACPHKKSHWFFDGALSEASTGFLGSEK